MSIVLETLIRHFEREPNAVMWPNGIALRHGEIAAVLRHHALPVADRIRELEAQLTLPPIREKFVRVSDELVAELKAAPSKPVTVAIVEDGNELHMTFTEAQQAASDHDFAIACSAREFMRVATSPHFSALAVLTSQAFAYLRANIEEADAAQSLTSRVLDAVSQPQGNVKELPPMREAMDVMMDEGLRTIGEKNAKLFTRSDAPVAASEPVAWAIVNRDGVTMDVRMTVTEAREHSIGGDTLRPLVFGDTPHPSAAGVTVTEAMVEAGAKALALSYRKLTQQSWEGASETWREEYRADARIALTAALTDPTTPTRGSDE